MTPDASLDSYVADWRRRAPELEILSTFLSPVADRRSLAWACLLQQIEEPALEPVEPAVARVKLAWWAEELARGTRGEARHPVLQALVGAAPERAAQLPLPALAEAALTLLDERAPPRGLDAWLARLDPLAEAVGACEAVLFGADAAAAAQASRSDLALHILLFQARRARSDWPLDLLARHGLTRTDVAERSAHPGMAGFVRDVAQALRPLAAPRGRLGALRAARLGVDRWRLARLARDGALLPERMLPGPLRALFTAWNAARRAPALGA